jgi:ribosomal protein L34E
MVVNMANYQLETRPACSTCGWTLAAVNRTRPLWHVWACENEECPERGERVELDAEPANEAAVRL